MPDRDIERRNGAFIVALVVIDVAERCDRHGVALVEFDGLLEVARGAIRVAAVAEHQATVEIGFGIARIQLDRLVEVAERLIAVVLGAIGFAAAEIGYGFVLAADFGVGVAFAFLLFLLGSLIVDDRRAGFDAHVG